MNKICLFITFSIAAFLSALEVNADGHHILVNQYKFEIPFHQSPIQSEDEIPEPHVHADKEEVIKPHEVYGIPEEYLPEPKSVLEDDEIVPVPIQTVYSYELPATPVVQEYLPEPKSVQEDDDIVPVRTVYSYDLPATPVVQEYLPEPKSVQEDDDIVPVRTVYSYELPATPVVQPPVVQPPVIQPKPEELPKAQVLTKYYYELPATPEPIPAVVKPHEEYGVPQH